MSHGLEGGEGAGDARVEAKVAVALDKVEASFELGEEEVNLGETVLAFPWGV